MVLQLPGAPSSTLNMDGSRDNDRQELESMNIHTTENDRLSFVINWKLHLRMRERRFGSSLRLYFKLDRECCIDSQRVLERANSETSL